MASSRKRSRQQLPSIESLLEDQQASANLKSALEVISRTRLIDFGREKLQSLGEAQKISWVFGNNAASTVTALCRALRCIDGLTTESQRSQILAERSGLSPSNATVLGMFIERECIPCQSFTPSVKQALAPICCDICDTCASSPYPLSGSLSGNFNNMVLVVNICS